MKVREIKMKPEISEMQVREIKDGYTLKQEVSEMQVREIDRNKDEARDP